MDADQHLHNTIEICIFCKSSSDFNLLYCTQCFNPFHEECIKKHADLTINKSDLIIDCCLNFLKALIYNENRIDSQTSQNHSSTFEDMDAESNHNEAPNIQIPKHQEIPKLIIDNSKPSNEFEQIINLMKNQNENIIILNNNFKHSREDFNLLRDDFSANSNKISLIDSQVSNLSDQVQNLQSSHKLLENRINNLESVGNNILTSINDSTIKEIGNRLQRQFNIILYGITEESTPNNNFKELQKYFRSLNKNLNNLHFSRLGEIKNDRCRPIRISLNNKPQQSIILKLKDKFPDDWSISLDRTWLQRQQFSKLQAITSEHNKNDPSHPKKVIYSNGTPTIIDIECNTEPYDGVIPLENHEDKENNTPVLLKPTEDLTQVIQKENINSTDNVTPTQTEVINQKQKKPVGRPPGATSRNKNSNNINEKALSKQDKSIPSTSKMTLKNSSSTKKDAPKSNIPILSNKNNNRQTTASNTFQTSKKRTYEANDTNFLKGPKLQKTI